MAMLWELVCYVNCACVTLMGRVEALEEMRKGSVSVTVMQTSQKHQQLLPFNISPTAIDNIIKAIGKSDRILKLMENSMLKNQRA